MTAQRSDAHDAARQRELADEYARRAGIARQMARSFGETTPREQRLARTLIELEPLGYTLLADRRRPGSGRGGVDLVLVGPGGVVLVDTRPWNDVVVADGRVRRGTEDVTAEVERLADLLHATQGELAELGLAPGEVHAMIAFTGDDVPRTQLFGVTLLGEAAAVTEIARLGRRVPTTRIGDVRALLEHLFPPLTTGPVTLPSVAVASPVLPPDGARLSPDELQEALLDDLRRAPVEEWMTVLHPGQARLVRRYGAAAVVMASLLSACAGPAS